MEYINITKYNIEQEHICCAIADKKHQCGVDTKKEWLNNRITEGHVFRKLDARGKVFIEYAPLETAWVPIGGDNYIYIYCLWVSGSFKEQGHGNALLQYCISEAIRQNKSGVCLISSKKKKPFLSDKQFMLKHDFVTVDTIGDDYELLALSYDGTLPHFNETAKKQSIQSKELTIYYGMQCPYIPNCIKEIESYCQEQSIKLDLVPVHSLDKAKALPCVFNNWAVFYQGMFKTVHLLNENYLRKLIEHPDI